MRLLMLAPPGAGKGTQAERLARHFGVQHMSTGDLLRHEVAAHTPLGLKAAGHLNRGDLVPDELVRDIALSHVVAANAAGGFILDGYPRNLSQAEEARRLADANGIRLDAAVLLDVSREESLRRLLHRAGQEGRSDDEEATIRHRLDVFESETRPLVDYYRSRGLLLAVDGEQPVDRVTEEILDRLGASVD